MNATGIIFASDNEIKLNELTLRRTTASLPFGGRYRLIDFALSNFVNSGINKIAIITRNNYESLMDHIRMGRDWDLNRKKSGIAVFPPYFGTSKGVYRGKIEALQNILSYVKERAEENIVIVNSNVATNVDFDAILQKFEETGADIMLPYYRSYPSSGKRVLLETDENENITDIMIHEGASYVEVKISLGAYVIKRDLLVSLVEGAYSRNMYDFERDILQRKLGSLELVGYEIMGYCSIIDDVKSYYNESMRLLDGEIREDLFYRNGNIYTKVKDSAPTIYREGAVVNNSLIADGCVIDGEVENSILFRGVKVEKGAVIRNSIVMEKGTVEKNAQISYCITDKNVRVTEGRVLAGYETYPIVIVKDKTV